MHNEDLPASQRKLGNNTDVMRQNVGVNYGNTENMRRQAQLVSTIAESPVDGGGTPVDEKAHANEILHRLQRILYGHHLGSFDMPMGLSVLAERLGVEENYLVQLLEAQVQLMTQARNDTPPFLTQLARIRTHSKELGRWFVRAYYNDPRAEPRHADGLYEKMAEQYNEYFLDPINRAAERFVESTAHIARNREKAEYHQIPALCSLISGWMHHHHFNPEACKPHNWTITKRFNKDTGVLCHAGFIVGDNLKIEYHNPGAMNKGDRRAEYDFDPNSKVDQKLFDYFLQLGFMHVTNPNPLDFNNWQFTHAVLIPDAFLTVHYFVPSQCHQFAS